MSKKNRKKGSYSLLILDVVLYLVTIGAVLTLIMTYLAGYINPEKSAVLSLLALAAPFTFLANIILLLYWIVRWRVFWIIVTLTPLLLGVGFLLRVFQPSISKEYKNGGEKGEINIVSYNVHGFIDPDITNKESTMDSCLNFVRQYQPNILCLQEFQTSKTINKADVNAKLKGLKYNVCDYRLKSSSGGFGLAIYSTYRILDSGTIVFKNSTNSMIWADLLIEKGDTLRVFNNHLQSTSIGANDVKYLEDHKFVSKKNDSLELTILGKLIKNNIIRSNQVDSIVKLVEYSPYPVVVCGDFNDTPMSYTYRVMRGDLKDGFVEKGSGLSGTFKRLFNILRIDFIFHSDDFTTVAYDSPSSEFSDHNPVVVTIKRALE